MNKIFILTPYGNDYHTGHLVLLGPNLEAVIDVLIEQETLEMVEYLLKKFVGSDGERRFLERVFPGRGYEWWSDIPWEERTPELLVMLRDFIIEADLPWEVIDPNLSAPMVLAEYSGVC